MRVVRPAMSAAAVMSAGFLIAACGGSGGSGTATVTKTHGTSTPASAATGSTTGSTTGATVTGAATGSTATTSPNAQATTVSPSGTPACVASMLALRSLGTNGATGHILASFALKNTTSRSCHTYGYPGVLFLGKSGQPLPTKSQRTTHDLAGAVALQRLTIAPGRSVYFRLLFADFNGSGSAGCSTAYGLQAIPPDDTQTLRTTIGNGVTECGTTTVTPLSATQG